MTGTIINVVAILAGSGMGVLFGARLPDRLKSTVLSGMGIYTAAVGMQMFLKTGNDGRGLRFRVRNLQKSKAIKQAGLTLRLAGWPSRRQTRRADT